MLVSICIGPVTVKAEEAFAYVDSKNDIKIPERKTKKVEIAKQTVVVPKKPVEDPLKDWKPDDTEAFDAYLVKEGQSREEAKANQIRLRNAKKNNQALLQMSQDVTDDSRAPASVKKRHKKKSKKKQS